MQPSQTLRERELIPLLLQIYVYSKPEDDAGPVSVRPMDTQELFGTSMISVTILLKNNAVLREAEILIKKWKDGWKMTGKLATHGQVGKAWPAMV